MSYTVVLNSEPTGTVSVRLGGLTESVPLRVRRRTP